MRKLLAKIIRMFLVSTCKFITGIQSYWQSVPDNQARIYYANHSSHLDGIVIWSSFPADLQKKIHPVAAKDYWSKSAFKQFIAKDVFNSILINRKPSCHDNPMSIFEEVLLNKHSIIIFPEGTRGNGEKISEFKNGLFHLAKNFPEVELVPVYLNNFNRVLPKGSTLFVPIICSAMFGCAITPLQKSENKKDFLARAKYALEELAS